MASGEDQTAGCLVYSVIAILALIVVVGAADCKQTAVAKRCATIDADAYCQWQSEAYVCHCARRSDGVILRVPE